MNRSVKDGEMERAAQILTAEYSILAAALGAAWSASLARTTIFLGVLSAAGVALGFAAQGGSGLAGLTPIALLVLPLLLFLGVATFIRLVQVQRESVVYITGMNRIRHFMQELAPASRKYFVLPAHDDQAAIYRSQGTGMNRRRPRFPLLYLVVQTQGIVGVVTGGVSAAFIGLILIGMRPGDQVVALTGAVAAFLITVALLFVYWQRSLAELFESLTAINPTPPQEPEAMS